MNTATFDLDSGRFLVYGPPDDGGQERVLTETRFDACRPLLALMGICEQFEVAAITVVPVLPPEGQGLEVATK